MRIGFFGGSFDPPHLGHLAVAKAASKAFSLDKILFVPAARQPLKSQGPVALYSDRLRMVSLLCETQRHASHFEASDLDAPLPDTKPNYTVNTLASLRKTIAASDSLFVIIGADAFLGLPHWHSFVTLLSMADWIVVSRPGFTIESLETLADFSSRLQHIHLLNGVEEPVSATTIRTRLGNGSGCEEYLPPSVLHYIRERHLYGAFPR